MRSQAILLAVLLCSLGVRAASAEMRPVTVENDAMVPIYRLYAWPSDLVPRTFNLFTQPLQPGDSRTIKVEDVYGSCSFSFQADFNNPRPTRRPTRLKPKYLPLAFREGIALCSPKAAKVSFK